MSLLHRSLKRKTDRKRLKLYLLYHFAEEDGYRAVAFQHPEKRGWSSRTAKLKKLIEWGVWGRQGCCHILCPLGKSPEAEEWSHLPATAEFFEKINAYLLWCNVSDIHGMHGDKGREHHMLVLQQETEEFKKNGGNSYLSVITGGGKHSHGVVIGVEPVTSKFLPATASGPPKLDRVARKSYWSKRNFLDLEM